MRLEKDNDSLEDIINFGSNFNSDKFEKTRYNVNKEKLENDLKKVIDIFSRYILINVKEDKLPNIKLGSESYISNIKSLYNPKKNLITIHKDHINKGVVYFEEVSHFLRTYIKKNSNNSENNINLKVQEFFGGLGRIIGKELTSKNKEISHLKYYDEEFPDLKKLNEKKKNIEKNYNSIKNKYNLFREKRYDVNSLIRGYYKNLNDEVSNYLSKSNNENIDEIIETIDLYKDSFRNHIEKYNSFLENYEKEMIKNKFEINYFEGLKEKIKNNKDNVKNILKSNLENRSFNLITPNNLNLEKKYKKLFLTYHSIKSHLIGYKYSKMLDLSKISNSDLNKIYLMKDSSIEKFLFKG